jgi:transposase
VIMESCGSTHHARSISGLGHDVQLLPAQYGRAYVRRNKMDAQIGSVLAGWSCRSVFASATTIAQTTSGHKATDIGADIDDT